MPVDKFGNEVKQRGTVVKDDGGISLSFANKTYIRLDGESDITGNLNMALRKIENLGDPTNPKDATSKEYVDNTKGSGVIGEIQDETANIKGNLDFMGQYRIKNLPNPIDEKDGVNRDYVDSRDERLKTELLTSDAFEFKNNEYQAKQDLYLKGFKIHGTGTPFQDADVVTKGYVESVSAPLLKLDEGKYKTKGDIDMSDTYTICNIRAPVEETHITDKKYVDETINFNSAFSMRNGGYEAKGNIYMRRNKILGLRDPIQDGEAATKKYVDDTTANLFIDENDNIIFGRDVDMENKKIFSLPEPAQDDEPATKKYVDDLQTQHVDLKGNVKFGRNINLDNKRIFSMKEPKKDNEGANKKYVDDTITKRIQEEKDNFLPQDPATKNYVDEAIRGIAGGNILVSKEGVFIKENGGYQITAPLDIDNQKVENIPDPVDEKDAVNKKYIDGVIEALTLKQGLVRENGGFNLVDSYINMNFNPVRNVAYPHHNEDAVPRSFVDGVANSLKEKIETVKKKIEEEKKESLFFKENGNYQALTTINMGFKRLLNLNKPIDPYEAARKDYVDSYFDETKENVENFKKETQKEVKESIDTIKQDVDLFKEVTRQQLSINEDIIQTRLLQFKQIILATAEFRGSLNTNEVYFFSFFNHSIHSNESFTMPLEGRILKIKTNVKRSALDGNGGLSSTPIGFDIENKILEFRLQVNDEERYLIFNPTQSPTTLTNPIVLQPDDEIKIFPFSNEPIRIVAFVVLVIELNF